MTDLVIPDVSNWQRAVNWAQLGPVAPAAIAKAANGTHPDAWFVANRDGMRAHGVQVRGYYQYLLSGQDAADQARALLSIVGTLQPGEFLICDLEEGTGDQSGRLDAWNTVISQAKAAELDYSGEYFWRSQLAGARTASHRWMAAYSRNEPGDPHDLWQYTDAQTFPGISAPCDASIFHGTIADLEARLGLNQPPPLPPRQPWDPPPFPGQMQLGEHSKAIAVLKVLLTACGYGAYLDTTTPLKAQTFDQATKDTVKAVQQLHDERVTPKWNSSNGVVGPRTWLWICDLVKIARAGGK